MLLLAVIVATLLLWLLGSHLASRVPANDDGTHHGLFAARILATHTVDLGQVAVGDVLGAGPHLGYYPLALHLTAALVASLAGVPVSTALVLVVVSLAAVAVPLGVCVLATRVFHDERLVGPAAAAIAVMFPAFPYYVSYWGGLTMISGVALVAALVDAAVGAASDGSTRAVGPLLGLSAFGLFCLHNSEIPTVAILAGALVAGPPFNRQWVTGLRAAAPTWLLAAITTSVLLLPQAGALQRGAAEREGVARLLPLSTEEATRQLVDSFLGLSSVAVALITSLVVVGLVRAVRRLDAVGWLAVLVGFEVLTYLSARGTALGDALSVPWYGRWDRVVVTTLVPLATVGGLGVAGALRSLTRALPGGAPRRSRLALSVLVVTFGVGVAWPQWRADRRELRLAFTEASLAGPAERSAFSWLAAHQRPGERVLNDVSDGSGWMYAVAAVRPVFAMAVHAFPAGAWGDRRYLLAHASDLPGDVRAACAAQRWQVRYAYVGPRVFPHRTPGLDRSALRSSSAWRSVYSRGGAEVFQRVSGPASCPADGRAARG